MPKAIALAILTFAASGAASTVEGQLSFGVQASRAQRSDFGIGPRLLVDLGSVDAGVRLIGSFEVYFPDESEFQDFIDRFDIGDTTVEATVDYWEANANLVYTFEFPAVPLTPYFGGGVNIARLEIADSSAGLLDTTQTKAGVNVLAGVEFALAGIAPFLEFRYRFASRPFEAAVDYLGSQWVVTSGIIF